MYLLCDGDWNNPEIEISDSSENLVKLGKILNELEESLEIKADNKESVFYSDCLSSLVLNLMLKGDDLLGVRIADHNLIFSGTLKAFQNIGQSLINFFEGTVKEGEHFHLDYYEGNMVLAQTNCHLIFMCNG
jgi:hypothetical protein